jgi:hypothetical protein
MVPATATPMVKPRVPVVPMELVVPVDLIVRCGGAGHAVGLVEPWCW